MKKKKSRGREAREHRLDPVNGSVVPTRQDPNI